MNSVSAPSHSFRSQFLAGRIDVTDEPASSLADDLKLFATFWLGGVVFFGTFLA
jgi:hypothetical protein